MQMKGITENHRPTNEIMIWLKKIIFILRNNTLLILI